jgi:hypothetical protein
MAAAKRKMSLSLYAQWLDSAKALEINVSAVVQANDYDAIIEFNLGAAT